MPQQSCRHNFRYSSALLTFIILAFAGLGAACSGSPTRPSQQVVNGSPGAPVITLQPSSEGLQVGQGASLFVEISSPTPVTYQWYYGVSGDASTPIAAATKRIYNTPNLLLSSSFWVRVSNSQGSVNSNTAHVEVRNALPPAGDPFEDQVLLLMNQARAAGAACGGTSMPPVPSLTMDASLQMAARLHSQDMALNNFFSHTSLDGRTFTQRIRNAGYAGSPLAENIGLGYADPQAVMNDWMASAGHCANIMSNALHVVGIGYAAASSNGPYWTADFGGQ